MLFELCMKAGYYLISILTTYMIIDGMKNPDYGITKNKMMEIINWENSTLTNVVVNRLNESVFNVDFYQDIKKE